MVVTVVDEGAAMGESPKGAGKPTNYFSYLLRLWREGEGGVGWRASLHNPHTGERLGFGSVDDLFRYLLRQIGTAPSSGEGQEGG